MTLVWVFLLDIWICVTAYTVRQQTQSISCVFGTVCFHNITQGKEVFTAPVLFGGPRSLFFFFFVFLREILRFMFMFATRRHFCQNLFGISGFGNIENNVTTFL